MEQVLILVQLFKLTRSILSIKILAKLSYFSLKSSKHSTCNSSKLKYLSNSNSYINSNVGFYKPRISLKLGNNSSFYKNQSVDKKSWRSTLLLPLLLTSPELNPRLQQSWHKPKRPFQSLLSFWWQELTVDLNRLTDNSDSHTSSS